MISTGPPMPVPNHSAANGTQAIGATKRSASNSGVTIVVEPAEPAHQQPERHADRDREARSPSRSARSSTADAAAACSRRTAFASGRRTCRATASGVGRNCGCTSPRERDQRPQRRRSREPAPTVSATNSRRESARLIVRRAPRHGAQLEPAEHPGHDAAGDGHARPCRPGSSPGKMSSAPWYSTCPRPAIAPISSPATSVVQHACRTGAAR